MARARNARRQPKPARRRTRNAAVPLRVTGAREPTVSPATALAAASTIAKFVHAGHPIARSTGHIGGGTSQPSFKFTKRLRLARTAAGTNPEYLVFHPSAANDDVDVNIKNLVAGSTVTNVQTTPDVAATAPGSLFPAASFASGALEQRFCGMEVKLTPTGAPLSMAGVIKEVIATEFLLPGATVIDDAIIADRRSKFVPKRAGLPVSFNYVHQDSDVHGDYYPAAEAFNNASREALMVIAIEPDGSTAVQYLLECVFHFEVIGTTVLGNTTPNQHNAPLYERIHHAAASLHTAAGGSHIDGSKAADHISKSIFGSTFNSLVAMATGAGKAVKGSIDAFSSVRGAYGAVKGLLGSGLSGAARSAAANALPLIEEIGPEAAMALIAL